MKQHAVRSEFICPKCKRPAERNTAVMPRNLRPDTMAIPYFLCGKCRLMFMSRRLARRYVSEWRSSKPETMKIPFESIYLDVAQFMAEIELYHRRIGYRPARFIPQTPPS